MPGTCDGALLSKRIRLAIAPEQSVRAKPAQLFWSDQAAFLDGNALLAASSVADCVALNVLFVTPAASLLIVTHSQP